MLKHILGSYFLILFTHAVFGQGEPFAFTELNQKPSAPGRYRLSHPFEIIYGPDDYLYVTERTGRVIRIDPVSGTRQILLDHRSNTFITISRNGSGWATSIGQDGMMGMALHPAFAQGTGNDYVYIAYTYNAGNLRISRFTFNGGGAPFLNNEQVLIQGLPASNDHSSGRLIFGGDSLLYYTCGDLGHNQFGNRCNEIRSQKLPTALAVSGGNYSLYSGKTLRMNRDGSIPPDNPLFNGVRSHIYTIGHRNAQGLVAEKSPTNGSVYAVPSVGGKIFNAEHGPRTDDEINIINSGKNYGWPYISGYLDNLNYQYVIWSTSSSCAFTPYNENTIPSGALVRQESDSVLTGFQPPVSALYTVCSPLPLSVCNAGGTDWMKYPTIAPSSIDFYPVNSGTGIPGWYPSLLVPTLRRGVLFRYKMNSTMDGFDSDSIPYFRTSNRYRDIAVSRDGLKIYVLTDSIGTTSGPSGTGTSSLANPGSVLEFMYTGTLLSLGDNKPGAIRNRTYNVSVYPNPAGSVINVNLDEGIFTRPIRFEVTNITGKTLLQGKSTERKFSINIQSLKNGFFILKLFNSYGLQICNEKVVVLQ